jgi:hypothetical protein
MMLEQYVTHRLQGVVLLPEVQRALQRLVVSDQERMVRVGDQQWGAVIPAVQRILGGRDEDIAPFAAAWALMYAASIRLDHLQDGDPDDDLLPTSDRVDTHYNLLFTYFLLAESLLDLLSPAHTPVHRILRLRRLWTDMALRMASGQQRDLTWRDNDCNESLLDTYQEIAQAKTGSPFVLAFAGTATLLTDDRAVINAFAVAGELYGTLLQYSDDLLDMDRQPNLTLTLAQAVRLARPPQVTDVTGHTPAAFGAHLYQLYRARLEHVLASMTAQIQQGVLDLFDQTFASHQATTGDTV